MRSTIDGRSADAMARYIVARVRTADPEVLEQGRAWYGTARAEARAIARETGCTVSAAAGIIAALSPRVRWSVNVRAAWAIARAAADGRKRAPRVGLGDARRKAWRIAHGARPLAVLGGDKVRSFYRNIMGDGEAVTVDVWAGRAAMLRWNRAGYTSLQYALVRDAYRAAARALGMRPCDVQATAWIATRGAAA